MAYIIRTTHEETRASASAHTSHMVLQGGCSLVLLFSRTDKHAYRHIHTLSRTRTEFARIAPSLGVVVTRPTVVSVIRCKSKTSAFLDRETGRTIAQIVRVFHLACWRSSKSICVEYLVKSKLLNQGRDK